MAAGSVARLAYVLLIGLDHYNAVPAIMNAILNPSVTDLRQSDIDGVEAVYGPAPRLWAHLATTNSASISS